MISKPLNILQDELCKIQTQHQKLSQKFTHFLDNYNINNKIKQNKILDLLRKTYILGKKIHNLHFTSSYNQINKDFHILEQSINGFISKNSANQPQTKLNTNSNNRRKRWTPPSQSMIEDLANKSIIDDENKKKPTLKKETSGHVCDPKDLNGPFDGNETVIAGNLSEKLFKYKPSSNNETTNNMLNQTYTIGRF